MDREPRRTGELLGVAAVLAYQQILVGVYHMEKGDPKSDAIRINVHGATRTLFGLPQACIEAAAYALQKVAAKDMPFATMVVHEMIEARAKPEGEMRQALGLPQKGPYFPQFCQ